jgi:hypothetical protein
MKRMNMSGDPAWNATVDSLRQDLKHMPEMSGQELKRLMPAHHARLMRLMDMHPTHRAHRTAVAAHSAERATRRNTLACCTVTARHTLPASTVRAWGAWERRGTGVPVGRLPAAPKRATSVRSFERSSTRSRARASGALPNPPAATRAGRAPDQVPAGAQREGGLRKALPPREGFTKRGSG